MNSPQDESQALKKVTEVMSIFVWNKQIHILKKIKK